MSNADAAQIPHEDHRPGQPAAVGRGPDLRLLLIGGVAAVLLGALIVQVGTLIIHPVTAGARFSFIGATRDCDTRMVDPPSSARCTELDFSPGGQVAVLFNVRNNGPLPMTLTRFTPQGGDPGSLYELRPAVVGSAASGSPAFIAFEPLTVPPFGETSVALVGSFGSCDVIGDSWSPGTYAGFATVAVNVQWGLLGIDHYVELPSEVHLQAPDGGQCR